MPLTPLHWSILLLGLLAFEVFYLPALAISSVIMDIEPAYYLFISPDAHTILHGPAHSFLGAGLIALAVALLLLKLRKKVDSTIIPFNLGQAKISSKMIIVSAIFGTWSHVILDSFLYTDIAPMWPFTKNNPFLGMLTSYQVYGITSLGLVAVLVLIASKTLTKQPIKNRKAAKKIVI